MEIYHEAKEAAYRALLDGGVSALPVDILRLVNRNAMDVYKSCDYPHLREGEYARTFFDGSEWWIVFDENIPCCKFLRHTLAHGLGHKAMKQPLFLGFPHLPIPNKPKRKYAKIDIPHEEKEAEAFARHLLAPLPLLREMGVTSSRDIATACQIPIEVAELQAEILEYYIAANVPLTALEAQLCEQCRGFIEKYRP